MSIPLNEAQERAASRLAEETFVSAGAGSGKTRVLAERFVRTVLAGEADGASASDLIRSILLITFTDKAAGELAERVRRFLLDRGRADLARLVDEAWISTIHGFCARVVRRHAVDIGIDPGFRVIADPETGIVRQRAFDTALEELIEHDVAVADMVDAHGLADVRHAVIDGLDRTRAMGADPAGIVVPEPPDLDDAIDRARLAVIGATEAFRDLRRVTVVEANEPLLAPLAESLAGIGAIAREDVDGAAARILELRDLFPLRASGGVGADVKDVNDALLGALEELRAAAAETIAARHASAWRTLIRAYAEAYRCEKASRQALDFEDLQVLTAELFEREPDVAERYAQRFASAMVDEFQDTNTLQLRAIEPVAGGRLCMVGDDKQSIYGFRFADPEVFVRRRTVARANDADGVCELPVNYRSHPELLSAFNDLFGHETFFGEDFLRLEAGRVDGWSVPLADGAPRIELLTVGKRGWGSLAWREAEAIVLAGRIAELVASGVQPGHIVVLLRRMTNATIYVRALAARGLRVRAEASGGFYDAPEVADVRALLAVLANPTDDAAMLCLCAGGLGGISDDGLYRLTHGGGARRGVFEALGDAASVLPPGRDRERAALLHEHVEQTRAALGRVKLADVVLDAAASLGPGGGCLAGEAGWATLRKCARIAAEFERVGSSDPEALLRHLEEREAFVKREPAALPAGAGDTIRLMSVHAAKGLEFPVVAVADLGAAPISATSDLMLASRGGAPVAAVRLPSSASDKIPVPAVFAELAEARSQADRAEETRVLYVACTRAEELLLLAGSRDLERPLGAAVAIDRILAVCEDGAPGLARASMLTVDAGAEDELLPFRRPPKASAESGPPPETAEPCGRTRPAPAPLVPPADLSYTGLDLYRRCGYRFYAERVLGVGALRDEADSPRGFGIAVHAALQLRALGVPPDDARLAAIAAANGLPADESDRLRAAVEAFAATAAAADAAGGRPEVPFSVDVAGGRPEVPFSVDVAGGTLVGTIDLLVTSARSALVIDYKTGRSALDVADAAARFRTQAEVYALALLRSGFDEVEIRFVEVERGGRETPMRFTVDDAATIEPWVADAFGGVAAGRFERLRAFDADICRDCPVSGSLCPIVARRERSPRGGSAPATS